MSSWNSKEQGGKDLKSSVAASWQGQSDPSSEKKRYQVRFCKFPFVKISVEDRAQDLTEKFSVEAAVQDSCVRLSVQGVSIGDLHRRSLHGISK